MQPIRILMFAVFASVAVTASGLHAASAQDTSTPGGYQFFVTPYLWLASVHATTLTPLAREPQVNSNVSSIDLLSHLDGAPFMGSFEVRYGLAPVADRAGYWRGAGLRSASASRRSIQPTKSPLATSRMNRNRLYAAWFTC